MEKAPMLYFDNSTGTFTTEPIPGAQTWQHKSMTGYRAWKRAQANMAAGREQAKRDRAIAEQNRPSPMECLVALLEHWERQ
jgi:hypothetical protein